jgi:hemerythrin-like domain-containing protein
VWRKFTEGYGGHWQAHHILEEKMFEKFRHFGDPNDGPSVILTEVEHKAITAKLLKAQTRAVETTAQLWKKYQDVYKKNPEYLEAIRHYFEKGK